MGATESLLNALRAEKRERDKSPLPRPPKPSAADRTPPMFDPPMLAEQENRAPVFVERGPYVQRVTENGSMHLTAANYQTLCGKPCTPGVERDIAPGICLDCRAEASRIRAVVR